MQALNRMIDGFIDGWHSAAGTPRGELIHEEKQLREQLSEEQIDNMLKDTFPASDPPSVY